MALDYCAIETYNQNALQGIPKRQQIQNRGSPRFTRKAKERLQQHESEANRTVRQMDEHFNASKYQGLAPAYEQSRGIGVYTFDETLLPFKGLLFWISVNEGSLERTYFNANRKTAFSGLEKPSPAFFLKAPREKRIPYTP